MGLIRILLLLIGIFLAIGVILLISVAITGRVSRAYPALSPDSSVVIDQKSIPLRTLAEQYLPELYIRENTPSPPLLWVYYEAVTAQKTIDLIFYYVWENEVNPNPVLDKGYWLFRAAYYGYPVRDIEFFEVRIDPDTGNIVEMLFETSPTDDYFVTISEHVRVRYISQPEGGYLEIRSNRDDVEQSRHSDLHPMFNDHHVLSLVQTWNHLTRLLTQADQDNSRLNVTLKHLSDQEYRSFKFTRKSQGDHQTHENPVSIAIGTIATACLVFIPAGIFYVIRRALKPITRP